MGGGSHATNGSWCVHAETRSPPFCFCRKRQRRAGGGVYCTALPVIRCTYRYTVMLYNCGFRCTYSYNKASGVHTVVSTMLQYCCITVCTPEGKHMDKSFLVPASCYFFTRTRSLVKCLILTRSPSPSPCFFSLSLSLSLSQTTNEASDEVFNNKITAVAAAAATGSSMMEAASLLRSHNACEGKKR